MYRSEGVHWTSWGGLYSTLQPDHIPLAHLRMFVCATQEVKRLRVCKSCHRCVVVMLQQCGHLLLVFDLEFNILWRLTLMTGVRVNSCLIMFWTHEILMLILLSLRAETYRSWYMIRRVPCNPFCFNLIRTFLLSKYWINDNARHEKHVTNNLKNTLVKYLHKQHTTACLPKIRPLTISL